MSRNRPVLTIGLTSAGSGVGSAVLRSLALSSLETRILCMDVAADTPGMHRGHCACLIPKMGDPGYRDALLESCASENVAALILGLDPELEPLSNMVPELNTIGCMLVASSPAVNRLLRNKLHSAEFFNKLGLPFVRTVPLTRAEELLDQYGFPLVAKPVSGSASQGVRILFDQTELLEQMRENPTHVAQPYLLPITWGKRKNQLRREDVYVNRSFTQRDEYMIQVLIDNTGEVFGIFGSYNLLKDGAVVRRCPVEHDDAGATQIVLRMAQRLAGLGLLGPCNFQGRLTEGGYFVYEINPRFSGGSGMRAALGFNEVEACLPPTVGAR